MENREFRHNPDDEINPRFLLLSIKEWKSRLARVDKTLEISEESHAAMLEYLSQAEEELGKIEHYLKSLNPDDPTYEFKKEHLVSGPQNYVKLLEKAAENLHQASKEYHDEATAEMKQIVDIKNNIEQMLLKLRN